ncbi:unnamed protein product [Leuciscus chuanchicus]
MAASGRKQNKKTKHTDSSTDLKAFDFKNLEEKKGSGSEDDTRDETPIIDKLTKKRSAETFDDDELVHAGMGNEVQNMLERFGADISKAMQTKRKRLEVLTKTSLKGSTLKLEQMWKSQQNQRQKLTQDYSQQVLSVLQQWETDVQKSEEQEEKLNNMEEMEKSHEGFLQGTQMELRKEMALLQKKIMMDTQQQEMATVRKSLQSMLF